MSKVSIVDYGAGNLLSIRRAFEHCGAQVAFVSTSEAIEKAERLVLPGVGAFAHAKCQLAKRGLDTAIVDWSSKNRPLLGICLGMQLLVDCSEEFGNHNGLGLIPGRVVEIRKLDQSQRIPHIGWSALEGSGHEQSWFGTPLANTSEGASVYFVHSFVAFTDDNAHILATTDYNGISITAAIRKSNVFGFQFHPEKSGPVGLEMIRTFLAGE